MDWPVDIAEAADLLGLERFAVQGLSAGAAYALACAFEIPHRLSGCGLISSINPGSLVRQSAPLWKRVTSWTLEHHPLLARSLIGPFLPDSPDQIDKIVARLESVASEPDRRLLRTPEFRAAFELALTEALRQGKGGNLDDIVRQIEPWGFALDAIAFKSIHLWHGAEDQIVPIAAAKALEGSLTYGVLTVCEGEGHLSTFVNRSDEILTWLSSAP
jgi:pimeloyl-ACP methyl ester carboxylesterase